MHPLITQVLNSTSKRCAEKVVDLTGYGGKLHVNDILPDIRESNLDILAAVREVIQAHLEPPGNPLDDVDQAINNRLFEVLTALSEGKESV